MNVGNTHVRDWAELSMKIGGSASFFVGAGWQGWRYTHTSGMRYFGWFCPTTVAVAPQSLWNIHVPPAHCRLILGW